MTEIICKCGAVHLEVNERASSTRLRCCCNSCRGFAKFMENDVLDELGAVELFQTVPAEVKIIQGKEALAAHLISENGIQRWYCASCKTHLANTLQKPKVAFIGLPLPRELQSPNAPELGDFDGYVQGKYAPDEKPERELSAFRSVFKIMWRSLRAKRDSDWVENGNWIVTPTTLSAEERAKLYEKSMTC